MKKNVKKCGKKEMYWEIYERLPLFQGIDPSELSQMLSCLDGKIRSYGKDEIIQAEDEPIQKMGILLEGCVQVVSEDVFGNRNILEQLHGGEMFGTAFACAGIEQSPVSVTATEESVVMQIDANRILKVCPAACPHHQKLIANMVYIFARKNVGLNEKIRHISKRSTREKLLSYLSEQSKKSGDRHFHIAFNRQELADYLGVERSAMSAELGKLRREGILEFKRSEFWLL